MKSEKVTNSKNEKECSEYNLSLDEKELITGTYAGFRFNVFPHEKDQVKKEENPEDSKKKENIQKMMHDEYSSLRDYLGELRNCQTTFFWSSITAAGVILTLAIRFSVAGNNNNANYFNFDALFFANLSVLLLVCPIWCIWFLKASSLARVAGYLRVLEDMITGRAAEKYKYIGWENSYFVYRRSLLKDREISIRSKGIIRPIGLIKYVILEPVIYSPYQAFLLSWRFEKPYQYNILSWFGFFILTSTCLFINFYILYLDEKGIFEKDLISIIFTPHLLVHSMLIPVLGWLFTFLYTVGVLSNLSLDNSRSMATREKLWRYLLDVRMFDSEDLHFLIKEREKEFRNKEEKEKKDIFQKLFIYNRQETR
jgi:hypothetical protein